MGACSTPWLIDWRRKRRRKTGRWSVVGVLTNIHGRKCPFRNIRETRSCHSGTREHQLSIYVGRTQKRMHQTTKVVIHRSRTNCMHAIAICESPEASIENMIHPRRVLYFENVIATNGHLRLQGRKKSSSKHYSEPSTSAYRQQTSTPPCVLRHRYYSSCSSSSLHNTCPPQEPSLA
jgi:hypothetical protein